MQLRETPMAPELDGLNYASRVKQPMLMMNGRHDAIFPFETSQLPLFNLLAPSDKRHLTFPGGHSTRSHSAVASWLPELGKSSRDPSGLPLRGMRTGLVVRVDERAD